MTGIAAAPRGVPQIEVTFDIDANGIVNVSAADKATGKSQDIRITAGSGLTEEEIKRMVREAEENKQEDQKRRELVDTRNNLDALILSSEKIIREDKDGKLAEPSKTELEGAIAEAKGKLDSQSLDELKAATERLQNVSHKIATEMYQAAGATSQSPPEEEQQSDGVPKGGEGINKKKDDDVVDADFKEV